MCFFFGVFLGLTVDFCCRLAVFLDLGLKGSGASEAFGARAKGARSTANMGRHGQALILGMRRRRILASF